MPDFQNPDSIVTLCEAVEEHKQNRPVVKAQTSSSLASEEFFASHDTVHALFGLDTSLEHEALVDTWSLFGTTIRWNQFRNYLGMQEHKEIIRSIGLLPAATGFVRAIPNILRVMGHSRRMTKKWPRTVHKTFPDSSLKDLRQGFKIDLIR